MATELIQLAFGALTVRDRGTDAACAARRRADQPDRALEHALQEVRTWTTDRQVGAYPFRPTGRSARTRRSRSRSRTRRSSCTRRSVLPPSALFSTGDAHCCQGDGEICVTGLEAPMYATMGFSVEKRSIPSPQFRTAPGSLTSKVDHGSFFATTGVGPDLYENAQNATRAMIEHLTATYELSREDAYLLCSLAVDLKISEIVDAGVFVVSALPAGGDLHLEGRLEDLLGDRGGRGAALTRVGEHDRDRDLGVRGGGEADEPRGVLFGSWAMSAVETSSAVPVLPATWTPGIAAARPVPYWTTAIIIWRTWPATLG